MNMRNQINKLLAAWDPIGVGIGLADCEYIDYIPRIMENAKNEQTLMTCLERILIHDMGLSYDRNDPIQYESIKTVCQEIYSICNQR